MEHYEIVIIGTGPAGLSAAITAKVRNKKTLLIGSTDLSPKIEKAHTIQNYLGLPDVSGEAMTNAFQRHLEELDIKIEEKTVSKIYAMGDYFGVQAGAEMIQADTVILATGVTTDQPLAGENELLGQGVSYCATCDAALYRGRKVAVIGFGPKEEAEADFLAEIAEKVYYIPMYKEPYHLLDCVEILREKPIEILGEDVTSQAVGGGKMVKAIRTDGGEYPVDGVFVLRESVLPEQLLQGLEVEKNHVVVNLQMETNIPGCYACGDITGTPYQYIKAAGQGNVAALSAVNYLAKH